MLYQAYSRELWGFPGVRWFLGEFDLGGNSLGPLRDLTDEFGFTIDEDVEFLVDAVADRYVLSWWGAGPDGLGLYYVRIAPAP